MQDRIKYFNRFITLFDAVIAIIMTIIVLTIKIPDTAHTFNRVFLGDIALMILWYAVSFYIVMNYWSIHHYIIEGIRGASSRFVFYNFIFLFFISLFPIACNFMLDANERNDETLRVFSVTFYMLINFSVSVAQLLILRYVMTHKKELVYEKGYKRERFTIHFKLAISKMLINIIPLFTAFFLPSYAVFVYIFATLLHIRIRAQLRKTEIQRRLNVRIRHETETMQKQMQKEEKIHTFVE